MSNFLAKLSFAILVTSALAGRAAGPSFDGAIAEPFGKIKQPTSQLRIQFPEEMVKEPQETFKVVCSPALEGFASWADNNTIWTYNFSGENEYQAPQIVGGGKCQITQVSDVKAASGKVWKSGTISYNVTVGGPNVTSVTPAAAYKGTLRETEPVLLITFDGPVDADKFFANQNGSLNYLSSNAPSEKMALSPVPKDQAEKIFEVFEMNNGMGIDFKDRRWILATLKQNLIPGAQVNLSIEKQVSADNADVSSEDRFTKEFSVRSQFEAEIQCANPSTKNGSCLPNSQIAMALNGIVKWADIKDAYIEYIPFGSTDKKTVRSFAEIDAHRQIGFWDNIINYLSYYFPYLAKYSDTVLDSVVFNVNIEPETQAKVVAPQNLTDLDGRKLANVLTEFYVHISAMSEVIRTPQPISFFEKNMDQVYLPVGVVNQNQILKIRKSGATADQWEPIRDPAAMIRLIQAYALRGEYRENSQYVSPLEKLSYPSHVLDQPLTGIKNRSTVLQFPFASGTTGVARSGLYAIEVSSPSFEDALSDANAKSYYNPKYVLAQVTDLAIHMKKGTESTTAWVTRLSTAEVVAGAKLEVFNCLGSVVASFTTDASGLVTFPNQEWAKDCQVPEDAYSAYVSPENFFVQATLGDDQTLIHSTWTSENSYALSAPGIEWFSSNIRESQPYFHAIVGVNLVKPGQQVPVEILAKVPESAGFLEVPADKLPTTARVVSSEDSEVYYEFPLTWLEGKAAFTWAVPADSSVQLGRYDIILGKGESRFYIDSSDIEVAEFKIPLMSGIISFPTAELVKPDSIPVSAVIRYANGVGAKKLASEISYYFSSTTIESKELEGFTFGTGEMKISEESSSTNHLALPSSSRPAVIAGLETAEDGSLNRDLATEALSDGRSISEVLKTVDRPQKMILRVRYQDQMGEYQTLSQAKNIYNSESYVGTRLVTGDRSKALLQAAVVNVDKKAITNLTDLEIKVVRIETRVIGEELYGGLIKNTLERELKPVRWTASCSQQKSVVNCAVGTLKEGSYAFQVTSKTTKQSAHTLFKVDSNGRVYGPNEYYNFGDDEGSRQLPLALNKESFKSGETATVSFASPFKTCSALVTVERNNVLKSSVVPNACEKGQVQVPVEGTFAPNVFVSIYAITGRAPSSAAGVGEIDLGRPTYRLGFANLKVNWSKFSAQVKVTTDQQKYEPGQDVKVQVEVRPEEGAPAPTKVTMVVLEEKILELKENKSYALLNSLMQMREHGVQTITPLERIETLAGGNPEAPAPSDGSRKGGDEGGDGGGSASEQRRRLFNALVSYQTDVPVVNGVANLSFKTNDSLTRFKVIAISSDTQQRFGTGEAVYLTEKETQSYSNIPTVAHTGDSYPLKVTVQNNSSASGKYKVEVSVVSKDRNGNVIDEQKCSKTEVIDRSASRSIEVCDTRILEEASSVEYVVRIYDENGKVVDVLQPDPQIVLSSVPLAIHESRIAQVENGSLTKTFQKESTALPGKGEIRVVATRSLVGSALAQVSQRLGQETFADFFLEARFNKALLVSTEAKPDELVSVLQTLVSSTDSEGFIKYYPQSSRGDVFLTASIINALQLQPWALKLVPAALKSRLQGAVAKVLSKSVSPVYIGKSPMDWMRAQVVMGQAAFAFQDATLIDSAKAINAGIDGELKRNPLFYGEPIEKWMNLDLLEKWLLEVSVNPATAKDSAFLKVLLAPARLVYVGNSASLTGTPSYTSWYTDETIETGKLLLGLSQSKGDKDLARNLAVGLVNASEKGWYNLMTMSRVSEGLKAFGKSFETVTVNGSALINIPEEQSSVGVDFSQAASGSLNSPWVQDKATVQVTYAGAGKPWVSVQALSAVPLTSPRSQGLSVEKQIKNISRDSGFQAGDIIEVTLKLHATASIQHLGLMDPIPAGSNVLAEAYGDYNSGQKSYSGYKLYFASLSSGVATVKYQYQLNNPGTFKLPPTRVEGLYLPSVFAETPNASLQVK